MTNITDMSALETAGAIIKKDITVIDAVNACFKKIETTKNKHNAFLALNKEAALKYAGVIQDKVNKGEILSRLMGVPVAVKDNINTIDFETTCASKMLEGYKPVFNAAVIDKLKQAGMIVIGKLNMDEFAMGGSSETGFRGPVKNPWDTARVAGGSSGGSAAAVAAGEVPVSLGSDTGGSIRQPCAFCGVTGIKPTYGAVSRYGAVAFASSLDQIGTIGRSIDDAASLLSVISGPDFKDSTCVIEKPFKFDTASPDKIKLDNVKLALPVNCFTTGVEDDVIMMVRAAAKEYEEAGAVVEEIELPLLDYMIHAYYIIACAEASSNMSRFDGLKYGYRSQNAQTLSEVYTLSRSEGLGIEVKRRILLGTFVLSSGYYDAYYKKALQLRYLMKKAYDGIFSKYDAVISPVSPTSAYKIGENIGDPVKMYMGDKFTVSVNLAGLPAVSLPCGFDNNKLPVGFQLIGDAFSEEKLVSIAGIYQNRTNHHKQRPYTQGDAG